MPFLSWFCWLCNCLGRKGHLEIGRCFAPVPGGMGWASCSAPRQRSSLLTQASAALSISVHMTDHWSTCCCPGWRWLGMGRHCSPSLHSLHIMDKFILGWAPARWGRLSWISLWLYNANTTGDEPPARALGAQRGGTWQRNQPRRAREG